LGSYSRKTLPLARYPLINQHRAGGDADATAILFSTLEWDVEGVIAKMIKGGTRPALT
jgi:DNA polymerase-3 subunit epsilon